MEEQESYAMITKLDPYGTPREDSFIGKKNMHCGIVGSCTGILCKAHGVASNTGRGFPGWTSKIEHRKPMQAVALKLLARDKSALRLKDPCPRALTPWRVNNFLPEGLGLEGEGGRRR